MTFNHHIRIRTEVKYPNGPTFDKFDYFAVSDEEMVERFRQNPEPNAFYDWLNNSGFWVKGWQEITDEIDQWIDSHPEVQGLQDEIAMEAEFI